MPSIRALPFPNVFLFVYFLFFSSLELLQIVFSTFGQFQSLNLSTLKFFNVSLYLHDEIKLLFMKWEAFYNPACLPLLFCNEQPMLQPYGNTSCNTT